MYSKYYRLVEEGHSMKEIADLHSVPYETLKRGILRYARRNNLPSVTELSERGHVSNPKDIDDKPFIEKIAKLPNGEEEVVQLVPEDSLATPEDLLVELGYEPMAWDVVESSRSKWGSKAGKTLYSVRVRVRPKKVEYEQFELLESILESVSKHKPEPIRIAAPKATKKQSIIIPLFDLHFSVGNLDFFYDFLEELAHKFKDNVYEEAVIVLGGDSLEHDNFVFTTEAGTRTEDTDIRLDYDELYKFLINLNYLCLEHAEKVRYINIRGNHSPSMDWALSHGMSYMFPDIEFDIEPETLKAIQVYDSFFGLEHGHIRAAKRDEQSIGYLFKGLFSSSKFHYILSGHDHAEKEFVKDSGTFLRIQFPSPAGFNQWSKDNYYHSQFRGLRVLVIEEGEGIKENFYFRNNYLD